VGVNVRGMIVALGGGRVAVGATGTGAHAARKNKKNKPMQCFTGSVISTFLLHLQMEEGFSLRGMDTIRSQCGQLAFLIP
jgi:hypothetical protein